MLKRIGVVVIWLLATMGTASLTYAAVSQAGRAVGDQPAMPVSGADIAARVSTTVPGTSTLPEVSTTIVADSTTVVTTTTLPPIATTTTTNAATTTTTTAASSHTEWKTVTGVGTVGVSVAGDSVTLVSASPVDPYHAEVQENGPDRVEVKFESESTEFSVRAEVEDGELVWEVSSGHEDGDGGD